MFGIQLSTLYGFEDNNKIYGIFTFHVEEYVRGSLSNNPIEIGSL